MSRPADAARVLPPSPDFRYVGLEPGPRARAGVWATVAAAGGSVAAGAIHGLGVRAALLGAVTASAAALMFRGMGGPRLRARWAGDAVSMAIVPWGILVDPDEKRRVLRWAAVKKVDVHMIHGRDEGTPTTLWSVVTVTTDRETFVGRTPGAVSIERLVAHLDAYAEEQSQAVALDLDGERAAGGPLEPEVEPLLAAARAWVDSAPASARLELPGGGYRQTASRRASERAIAVLRAILRDKARRPIDPRAFAAVLAAEIHGSELAEDLVALVQSPHPVLAAVAKGAARRLGVSTARVGALDEVAPFLCDRDVEALAAWSPPPSAPRVDA